MFSLLKERAGAQWRDSVFYSTSLGLGHRSFGLLLSGLAAQSTPSAYIINKIDGTGKIATKIMKPGSAKGLASKPLSQY